MYPVQRPRRLRGSLTMRALVRETHLSVDQLVYPVFVRPGKGRRDPIGSMPGIYQWSLDTLVDHLGEVYEAGVRTYLLFGIPNQKDEVGSQAYDENGIVQEALRALRERLPDSILIADLCLCEYTSHGHCGVLDAAGNIDNDPTVALLAQTAVAQAQAGASIIAPSDMMDGRVGAIRTALDADGFEDIPIMSYAAKYASGFYGPFREAAQNTPTFGDRKTYQMDVANRREALKEVQLDLEEGADMIIVKPALPYLDILREVRDQTLVPIAGYQVSGEYAMIKAAAANGWIEERRVVEESLVAIRRAGADMLITYFAPQVARWLADRP